MQLITEPTIYILGRQVVDANELDRFLDDHGVSWETDTEVAADTLCETAGRVCYMSFAKPRPGGNAAYLGHIKEVGHGSVLEHAAWNLLFTGVSRTLTHELVRHRAGMAYSQLSQRYVDESVAEYVVPPDLRREVKRAVEYMQNTCGGFHIKVALEHYWEQDNPRELFAGLKWLESVERSHENYVFLSNHLAEKAAASGLEKTEARKFARQAARSVLPNATETKIFVTMNGRAARHFLEMRGSRHAEPEIRILAGKLLGVLQQESPGLFSDYTRTPLPDGTFEIQTPYRKV